MIVKSRFKIIMILILVTILVILYPPNKSLAAGNKTTSILLTAKDLIGTPYKSGGITPNGFDCSGFVNYVYKKHGFLLSRSSSSLWSNGGQKVSNLVPGDLLFFKTNGRTVSHVGIYLGSGKFMTGSRTLVASAVR